MAEHRASARRPPLPTRLARAASQLRGDLPLAVIDLFVAAGVYLSLFLLRFDFSVSPSRWHQLQIFLPAAVAISLVANLVFGAYGRTWQHASIDEAVRLLSAGAATAIVLLAVFVWADERVPLTVLVAGPPLATLLFGLVRFQSRLFAFHRVQEGRDAAQRVAVVGLGSSGAAALRAMQADRTLGLVPVVVVDDDASLRGRSIHGVRVAGGVDALASVVADHDVDVILLALDDPPRAVAKQVAAVAEQAQVPVRVLRTSGEWVQGMPRLRDLATLSIEDLVGREQVEFDLAPVRRLLHGRRVLVTGGGGWIGSEIARQVAAFGPASLVLLDHDETHLHDTLQTLRGAAELALADIRDPAVIDGVFERFRPEVVFHAAAHKHVPILEDYACEAARTNVFGTLNVLDACDRAGVGHLVCISTDKAATPTSVMGASKWLAEQVVLERATRDGYCSVRFGNVLGSRGSVVPTFRRQIESGGPVTVTDPRMTRFFMSTDEAVRLVLLAAAIAGEHKVLALEMGEQVNIYELAERMIRLCGLRPHDDIEIVVTGPRPGEKLAELVVGPGEVQTPAIDGMLNSIEPVTLGPDTLAATLAELEALCLAGNHDAARELLLRVARPAAVTPLSAEV